MNCSRPREAKKQKKTKRKKTQKSGESGEAGKQGKVEKQRNTEAEKLKSKQGNAEKQSSWEEKCNLKNKPKKKNIISEERNPPFSSFNHLSPKKKSDFSRQGAGIVPESASRPYCNCRH